MELNNRSQLTPSKEVYDIKLIKVMGDNLPSEVIGIEKTPPLTPEELKIKFDEVVNYNSQEKEKHLNENTEFYLIKIIQKQN